MAYLIFIADKLLRRGDGSAVSRSLVPEPLGEPFADGTFWSDGTGWED